MSFALSYDNDDFEDELDYDDEYMGDSDESQSYGVLPCPDCGAEIFDDAVQCPHCGWYVTWDTPGGRSTRWDWLIKVGLILIVLSFVGYAALSWLMSTW